MRVPVLAVAGLVLLAFLAGCSGGPAPSPSPSPSSSGPDPVSSSASSTTPEQVGRFGGTGIRLSGEVRRLTWGFAANLSAYNDGPGEAHHGVAYRCEPQRGSWYVLGLSGPPGDHLDYHPPGWRTPDCGGGYSGHPGDPMPVGTYVNWTFAGRQADQCTGSCDNVWDGNLTARTERAGPRRRGPTPGPSASPGTGPTAATSPARSSWTSSSRERAGRPLRRPPRREP